MKTPPEDAVLLAINLDAEGKPPKEFRIFTTPKVKSKKGTFTFDSKAALSVTARHAEWNVDMMVDYEHLALKEDASKEDRKASGWFRPELRDGELWATNVVWTPAAAQAIIDLEYRYISPAFLNDGTKAKNITELINCALTNMPATHSQTPLLASWDGTDQDTQEGLPMRGVITMLGLADTAGEAEIVSALSRMRDFQRDVCALTGRESGVEALGAIQGWKAAHQQVEQLNARVQQMEADRERKELESLVADATNGPTPRITPAQRDWAMSMKPAQFKVFLSTAPVLLMARPAGQPAPSGSTPTTLSSIERDIIAAAGITEERYLAARKHPAVVAGAEDQ